MSRTIRWIIILFAALAPSVVWATPLPVHFNASVGPAKVHPGEIATVTVVATVDPKWHIYSVLEQPGGPSPSVVKGFGDWQAVGVTREDDPRSVFDTNFGLTVLFHEGHAQFSRQFRVPAGSASGSAPSAVSFHYQTCNDRICLPPTDVAVPLSVSVSPGPVRAAYAVVSSAPATSGSLSAPAALRGAGGPTHGGKDNLRLFLLFLLAAVLQGLLALVTPCVFPLIPITLTSFLKQAEGDRRRFARMSVGYALGIIGLYVAVGAVASATLGAAGANRIAANPWVNLIEFVVFVLFALSFFEVVMLQLPASLQRFQANVSGNGGRASLFAMGISFVLASFTCTAPFVGTLLVTAATGHWARPIVGMVVFASAFASPFFLFAAFPQWITKLPRSGVWLARTKATLGFVELAASLKFLSNADQVWQWKVLTQPVLLTLWALICIAAALYLLGIFRFGIVAETEPKGARPTVARATISALFAFAGAVCIWGLSGRPVGALGAFLPPPGYGGYGRVPHVLEWGSDYTTSLARARSSSRLLLVDFTGYTCTNCRYNEKTVFPRPEVQKELAAFERVQLYTDGGKDGPANQKLQQDKLGDLSLPLYAIIDPASGAVVSRIAGVVTEPQFTEFLSKAGPAQAQAVSPSATTPMWGAFSDAALGHGRPAIVDFTADWCVNCKAIERTVFENPTVKPELASTFTTMRVDMTAWDGSTSQAFRKRFGIDALPAVLLFDANGHEIRSSRITGLISTTEFESKIKPGVNPASAVHAVMVQRPSAVH